MAKLKYPTVKKVCTVCHEKKNIPKSRKVCAACRTFATRVKSGQILPPTYDQTTVAKYKEPMEEVENGFGYYGAVTETTDGEYLQCHICGYFFKRLSAHVPHHDMTSREYKQKFGLRIQEGLMSPVERRKAQAEYNANQRENLLNLARAGKLAHAKRKAKDWKTGGDMWTAQSRNEKGNCKEQTLAKIKHLASVNNGVATYTDFQREYGGVGVVKYWFGTWSKAVEAAGLSTYSDRLRINSANLKEEILDSMNDFYDTYGRTPQFSDLKTSDKLPDPKTVMKYYGTLNNARNAAGIPLLVFISKNEGWVEMTEDELAIRQAIKEEVR